MASVSVAWKMKLTEAYSLWIPEVDCPRLEKNYIAQVPLFSNSCDCILEGEL